MNPVTRVKSLSAAVVAAALLTGLTAATVTENAGGTFTATWSAPGTHGVTVRTGGRTVARGGATGSEGLGIDNRELKELRKELLGG
ncbi:hypothetical protein R6L23_33530 [Streptomyces sp. SR27]|uniref:hypothetical protein n=1 Tax=Streptomyces sp. SR27 TaxID=3076630 RepID=UPI00295B60C2|nr:hypothetical protein [Streptomyces sp. SR27]MDV9193077.1 hypothetical protein [Streptomyces sp. SR27]